MRSSVIVGTFSVLGLIPDFLCRCSIAVPQLESCQHCQSHSSHWFVIKTDFPSLFIIWSFGIWYFSTSGMIAVFSSNKAYQNWYSQFFGKQFWKKLFKKESYGWSIHWHQHASQSKWDVPKAVFLNCPELKIPDLECTFRKVSDKKVK